MKRKQDERGNLVRVYETGDGIRRKFYDAVEDSRFSYPRRLKARRSLSWYCGGSQASRPLNGIWSCAALAEHLLNIARTGKLDAHRPTLQDAARYYASTRRAMRGILSHTKVTRRLYPYEVPTVRRTYERLCAEGTALLSRIGYLTPTTGV